MKMTREELENLTLMKEVERLIDVVIDTDNGDIAGVHTMAVSNRKRAGYNRSYTRGRRRA